VESSRWGKYQGTLDNVSHLDLINWTNRLRVRKLHDTS
jgi:triacylglycerol lipase